jgi:uncharacterized protein YqgC (DUF456 family)
MRSTVLAGLVSGLSLFLVFQATQAGGGGMAFLHGRHSYTSSAGVSSNHEAVSLPARGSCASRWAVVLNSATVSGPSASRDDSDASKDSWLRRGGRITGSILGRALLYLVLLAGLVMIPLGLAGTFVMVAAAALFGLLTGFNQITLRLLGLLLGLALLGEGIESLLGVAMARKYGASKWGMWGAFLGGIFGAIVGTPVPVVGNLVGAFAGVFLGAILFEWLGRGITGSSLKAGWGALMGRAAASAIKLALGMAILILVVARTLG